MPIKWVRLKHSKHGGETEIPYSEAVLGRYRKRGWRPVDESKTKVNLRRPEESAASTESEESR